MIRFWQGLGRLTHSLFIKRTGVKRTGVASEPIGLIISSVSDPNPSDFLTKTSPHQAEWRFPAWKTRFSENVVIHRVCRDQTSKVNIKHLTAFITNSNTLLMSSASDPSSHGYRRNWSNDDNAPAYGKLVSADLPSTTLSWSFDPCDL